MDFSQNQKLETVVMTLAYETRILRDQVWECRKEMSNLNIKLSTLGEKAQNLEDQLVQMHLDNQQRPHRVQHKRRKK